MIDLSQSLVFGGVSTIISSLPAKYFFNEMKKKERKNAIALLILVWLALLLGFGAEFYFSFDEIYVVSFIFSVLFLSYCLWIIAIKKVKFEIKLSDKIKIKDKVKAKVIKKSKRGKSNKT